MPNNTLPEMRDWIMKPRFSAKFYSEVLKMQSKKEGEK